jgi:hypothetical protein
MRDANSDAISQHLPCKVTNKLAHRQGKGKRDDSEWRVASGEWNEGEERGLKVAPVRRSNKLPAQVAISHDENGSEWRVANSRGERRFALNSHDGRRQRMATGE